MIKMTSKKEKKRLNNFDWKFLCYFVVISIPLVYMIGENLIHDIRVREHPVNASAYIDAILYKGKTYNIKVHSYFFEVDAKVYHGSIALPHSICDKYDIGDTLEICYENGNPNNSTWSGYVKK